MGGQTLVSVGSERIARVFTRNGKANAKLIAAAPDLYEALDSLLTAFDEIDDADEWPTTTVIFARAALHRARARGETQ